MAKNNIRIKPVEIELDKKRHLLLDFNAYCDIEEEYGDFQYIFEKMQGMSPIAIRALLWAGLKHEDEELTLKEVGRMIGLADREYINERIIKALELSMPEAKNSKASPKTEK